MPVLGIADVRRYVRLSMASQRRSEANPTTVFVPIVACDEADTGSPPLRPFLFVPDAVGTGG